MKPTKNRFMCPDCGRVKMLFDSEKQANNFIKFNKDDIPNHGGTLRAYYCDACCGWHITHVEYKEEYEQRAEKYKIPIVSAGPHKTTSFRVIHEDALLREFVNANTPDTIFLRKQIRKWALENCSSEDVNTVCQILGDVRKEVINGRSDSSHISFILSHYKLSFPKLKEIFLSTLKYR